MTGRGAALGHGERPEAREQERGASATGPAERLAEGQDARRVAVSDSRRLAMPAAVAGTRRSPIVNSTYAMAVGPMPR